MNDNMLIALGRQTLEFMLQKEELFRALQQAQAKVTELEAKLKEKESPAQP